MLSGDLKASTEVVCQLLEETIQTVANGGLKQSVAVDVGSLSRAADVDCSDNGLLVVPAWLVVVRPRN